MSSDPRWRQHEACVDYLVYVHSLPHFTQARWQQLTKRMQALGHCVRSGFGVVTVRGDWGFFQIPAAGFPELKVTFFQTAGDRERTEILSALTDILELQMEMKR
ncbi:MAG: hypothetical protein P8178_10370 [Candidatus Thiodiazotropha sp.]